MTRDIYILYTYTPEMIGNLGLIVCLNNLTVAIFALH